MIDSVNFEFIDDPSKLDEITKRIQTSEAVALDTEFERRTTFEPIPGLVQVAISDAVWLFDPMKLDLSGLLSVCTSHPVLIMHACSEDLEVLYNLSSTQVAGLIDTQVGAAFLGLGISLGYANFIKHMLGISLEKEESQSDWLQRPLSKNQLRYAANDVYYLLKAFPILQEKLAQLERESWWRQDCKFISQQFWVNKQTSTYPWQELKGAKHRLTNGKQRLACKLLAEWREERAVRLNKPRSHILKDLGIVELAEQLPNSNRAIRRIGKISHHLPEAGVKEIRQQLTASIESDSSSYPEPLPKPLAIQDAAYIKRAKSLIRETAAALNLPPELIASNKHLNALFEASRDQQEIIWPEPLKGWRAQELTKKLTPILIEFMNKSTA